MSPVALVMPWVIGAFALALLVVVGIQLRSSVYFEVAMLIGLMGFIGTVVLSKFLIRGDVIE